MNKKNAISIVWGIALIVVAAVILVKTLHRESRSIAFSMGDPLVQAEFERILKKYDVPYSYLDEGSNSTVTTDRSKTTTIVKVVSSNMIFIKDEGTPNYAAAMLEYSNWIDAHKAKEHLSSK